MLLQFSVSNFASIRDEITVSMLAGSDSSHEASLLVAGKERLHPMIGMYGANAAGKTNIIRALTTAIMLIRESNTRQITDKMSRIVPFLFDSESAAKPTAFDFIFFADGQKYQYGFSADQTKIIEEYLYVYKSTKPSMIFERTNTNQYNYVEKERSAFKGYEEKNTDNKLFLSTATAWNCKATERAFRWFAEEVEVYNGNSLKGLAMGYYMDDTAGELNDFVTQMLQAADTGISGYEIESEDTSMEDMVRNGVRPDAEYLQRFENGEAGEIKKAYFTTVHKLENDRTYRLPLLMESDGTRRLFYMSPILKDAMAKGKTIAIDEMDASFHPLLVSYILSLFTNPDINRNHAQIIFNTQDVSILTLDRFRRDQVYFVERAHETGITELYSLDEFSQRKSTDVRKRYLQGRYGAVPVIVGDLVAW